MARFHCDRCGKCCISLGRHISIERKLSPTSHYCRVAVTRQVFPVTIQPEHREIFLDPPAGSAHESWCPYLRRDPDGTFICTIYHSRPSICKNFVCYSMIIRDESGEEAGRIRAGKDMKSKNSELIATWEKDIVPLSFPDRASWQRRAKEILKEEGYTVEMVD